MIYASRLPWADVPYVVGVSKHAAHFYFPDVNGSERYLQIDPATLGILASFPGGVPTMPVPEIYFSTAIRKAGRTEYRDNLATIYPATNDHIPIEIRRRIEGHDGIETCHFHVLRDLWARMVYVAHMTVLCGFIGPDVVTDVPEIEPISEMESSRCWRPIQRAYRALLVDTEPKSTPHSEGTTGPAEREASPSVPSEAPAHEVSSRVVTSTGVEDGSRSSLVEVDTIPDPFATESSLEELRKRLLLVYRVQAVGLFRRGKFQSKEEAMEYMRSTFGAPETMNIETARSVANRLRNREEA